MCSSDLAAEGSFEYEFDALQPYKGFEVFVSGICDVEYEIENDDPDVGYIGGIEINITSIVINNEEKGKGGLNLDSASELYRAIESVLLDGSSLNDAAVSHAESNYDYDGD